MTACVRVRLRSGQAYSNSSPFRQRAEELMAINAFDCALSRDQFATDPAMPDLLQVLTSL